jgi:hypothetical protein
MRRLSLADPPDGCESPISSTGGARDSLEKSQGRETPRFCLGRPLYAYNRRMAGFALQY